MELWFKALHSLTLGAVMRLLVVVFFAYLIGGAVFAWGMGWLLTGLTESTGLGTVWMQTAGTLAGAIAAWFLFPLLYPVLVSFFDDQVADAVERADYPHLPPAQPPFWPTLWHDVRFTLKALALNILCLPIFLIPVMGWAAYFILNGYLLGVQFFRMVAGRRMPMLEAEILRRRHSGQILVSGVLVSFLATIPLLNLVAPLLGVTMMVHLYHRLVGNDRQQVII